MTAPPVYSYDEVQYESHPFPESHPDRLATVARLFGLTPPDVSKCRVLELGCAAGGNIVPIAEMYPQSEVVGVDLSAKQIAHGQGQIAELRLTNVKLQHTSILDVDASFGSFDYIICHGVYSWVQDAVQDKILSVCKANLTPTGVAYVSYNTLPGWHMRGMIRDMMRYHASRFTDPTTRIAQARALLDFLVKAVGDAPNNPYSSLLKTETDMLKDQQDWYLYHEHLEEINSPIYFHQFVERAAARGLRFLGESVVRQMVPGNYPPEVEEVLQRLSNDIIHMEQYMDFLRNRMFRHTLLCHPEQRPDYSLTPNRLAGLHVASRLKPESPRPDLATPATEKFQLPQATGVVQISEPLAKHAAMMLAEAWPRTLPFEELVRESRRRLTPALAADPASFARDSHTLGRMFLQFLTSAVPGLIELRSRPLPVANVVPDKPMASASARVLARSANQITNLKHELSTLGEFERHIVQRLDGTRDRAQLLEDLIGLVQAGTLTARMAEKPVTEPVQLRALMSQALDQALARFVEYAYLLQ